MKPFRFLVTFILITSFAIPAFCAEENENIGEKEKKRMKLNKKFDKIKLREKTDFVIDTSPEFLIEPKQDEPTVGEYTVAKVPPHSENAHSPRHGAGIFLRYSRPQRSLYGLLG